MKPEAKCFSLAMCVLLLAQSRSLEEDQSELMAPLLWWFALICGFRLAFCDDCTEQLLIASARRPRIRMIPSECNDFFSSFYQVTLAFYQSETQTRFNEWASRIDQNSSIFVCAPGTCSEEHGLLVAYLVCLLATQEPRCVEILHAPHHLGHGEVVDFVAMSGVCVRKGLPVDALTWDFSDEASSTARGLLMEAADAVMQAEAAAKRKERQALEELSLVRAQKHRLQEHYLAPCWQPLFFSPDSEFGMGPRHWWTLGTSSLAICPPHCDRGKQRCCKRSAMTCLTPADLGHHPEACPPLQRAKPGRSSRATVAWGSRSCSCRAYACEIAPRHLATIFWFKRTSTGYTLTSCVCFLEQHRLNGNGVSQPAGASLHSHGPPD